MQCMSTCMRLASSSRVTLPAIRPTASAVLMPFSTSRPRCLETTSSPTAPEHAAGSPPQKKSEVEPGVSAFARPARLKRTAKTTNLGASLLSEVVVTSLLTSLQSAGLVERALEVQEKEPKLSDEQANLIAILQSVLDQASQRALTIPPLELVRLHWQLVRQHENLWASIRSVQSPEEYCPLLPCDHSTFAFGILAKYAAKFDDVKTLQHVGRSAIAWQSYRRNLILRRLPLTENDVPFSERMSVERQERTTFERLLRTLLLSCTIRRAPRQIERREGQGPVEPRYKLPSQERSWQPGDDAFALSKLLRMRAGALKVTDQCDDRPDEQQPSRGRVRISGRLRLSRHYSVSRQLPYRQSHFLRRINVLLQRRPFKAHRSVMRQRRVQTRSKQDGTDLDAQYHSTRLLKAIERMLRESTALTSAKQHHGGSEVDEQSNEAIEKRIRMLGFSVALQKWKRHLRLRQKEKDRAASVLSTAYPNLTGNPSQERKGMPPVPTWLLLAALQNAIDAGLPRLAIRFVRLYLHTLLENNGASADALPDILPVNARVLAVREAQRPPNSSSLLNAILRAHLMTGARDSWEHMLNIMDAWCSGGAGFANEVRAACGMKPVNTSVGDRASDRSTVKASLHPNETSILLMLAALRQRRDRIAKGRAVVRGCWMRWAPTEVQPKAQSKSTAITDPSGGARFRSVMLTMHTFESLIQQAIEQRSAAGVAASLALLDEWKASLNAAHGALQSGANPAEERSNVRVNLTLPVERLMYELNRSKARRQKLRWSRHLDKAISLGLLSPVDAEHYRPQQEQVQRQAFQAAF